MDLTLIDEIADIVILLENEPLPDPCDNFNPSLSLIGNDLSCSEGVAFTWYLDDAELPSETTMSFTPTTSGVYYCMAENVEGCILPTNALNVAACLYGVFGCLDSTADNFDSLATISDDSCTFPLNNCLGDFDNNLVVDTGDLLSFLTFFGSICD